VVESAETDVRQEDSNARLCQWSRAFIAIICDWERHWPFSHIVVFMFDLFDSELEEQRSHAPDIFTEQIKIDYNSRSHYFFSLPILHSQHLFPSLL
jgi:hypothetical protein